MKILTVGHGGREGAFAKKLRQDGALFAVMGHDNPTIAECAARSGGEVFIADVNDGDTIARFAARVQADVAFVNSDEPLARGVVDKLLAAGINTVGPTRAAARIEWDKVYAMNMMAELFPQFTPHFRILSAPDEVAPAVEDFRRRQMAAAVKPQGLTGGKGVRVMGEHLRDYQDAAEYAENILRKNEKVLLTEKLSGAEFTIMAMTDGERIVYAPPTYDYPYRLENDRGAGTGGMGCFAHGGKLLPFMNDAHFDDCKKIIAAVIAEISRRGLRFNGALNGGFFLTEQGVRFMEFNSRFGDPEAINVLSLLDSSFAQILRAMAAKTLRAEEVVFLPQASVVKYLVAPAYPGKGEAITFRLPAAMMEKEGVSVIFSAATKTGDGEYTTVGSSRVVALECKAGTVAEASDKINRCIQKHCAATGLEYRADIGDAAEMARLENMKKTFGG